MELREYFKIIRRYWKVFWGSVLIVTLAVVVYTLTLPKTYLASTTLTVNKASAVRQSQVNYYIYDNFYNVQSSALFSQIVTVWLSSAPVIQDVYAKAGVPLPAVSQKKLAKTFVAARTDPSTINLSIVSGDRDQASKLINAASEVMQEKTNELARTDQENVYDIVKFSSMVTDNKPDIGLNTAIGLIAGIFLGIILALGVQYFRRDA